MYFNIFHSHAVDVLVVWNAIVYRQATLDVCVCG